MIKYKRRPEKIEAVQWLNEEKYEHRAVKGYCGQNKQSKCEKCKNIMSDHGQINFKYLDSIYVCPGDFVIDGVAGYYSVMPLADFNRKYTQ